MTETPKTDFDVKMEIFMSEYQKEQDKQARILKTKFYKYEGIILFVFDETTHIVMWNDGGTLKFTDVTDCEVTGEVEVQTTTDSLMSIGDSSYELAKFRITSGYFLGNNANCEFAEESNVDLDEFVERVASSLFAFELDELNRTDFDKTDFYQTVCVVLFKSFGYDNMQDYCFGSMKSIWNK